MGAPANTSGFDYFRRGEPAALISGKSATTALDYFRRNEPCRGMIGAELAGFDPSANCSWMGQVAHRPWSLPAPRPWLAADPGPGFFLNDPFRAPVLGSVEGTPLPSRPAPRIPPQVGGETLGIKSWTAPNPIVIRPPGTPAVQTIAAPAFPLIADEDTVEAFQAAWETNMSLPALFPLAPGYGRLKSPQPPLYAQVGSEFLRREKSGTGGAWFDTRKVTIIVRGNVKADVVAAAGQVLAVFNEETTLVYPSGARFFKWWPGEEIKLAQDPDTKAGYDVWTATLTAEVTSIRSL